VLAPNGRILLFHPMIRWQWRCWIWPTGSWA